MLHQVGVSFDLYYDARKHKIKILDGIKIRRLGWTGHVTSIEEETIANRFLMRISITQDQLEHQE